MSRVVNAVSTALLVATMSTITTVPVVAFTTQAPSLSSTRVGWVGTSTAVFEEPIVSPFDSEGGGDSASTYTATDPSELPEGDMLELTYENVDLVLEEMRPYLIQDGGNVRIDEIDGPVVRLQLEGACGTCPSSTQTMKMGLERRLRERIPEIQEVVQAMPEGPDLVEDEVNVVLDGVRPFLQVAGGSISIVSIEGEGSVQPTVVLKMEGASATLSSVRLEIAQRLQRHFMLSGLIVDWDE